MDHAPPDPGPPDPAPTEPGAPEPGAPEPGAPEPGAPEPGADGPASRYDPPEGPLAILHDDHQIVVLDKPAGLLSVPGKGAHLADCLLARVRAVFPTALLVHRLDRDTSGVMVFALTPLAQRHLGWQFEERRVKKTYLARLWGETAAREGRIDLALKVDWPNRPRQMVAADGRPALTRWRALCCAGGETRARLTPETGRSHQLRVHMAAIGHPILGDPFYAQGPARDFPRLMLHSESLTIRHPDGGRRLRFAAAAPF
jgi:tRNA pseudouridine32 synthase/23S rRNA pseudouridine746 synthase